LRPGGNATGDVTGVDVASGAAAGVVCVGADWTGAGVPDAVSGAAVRPVAAASSLALSASVT
jgi:hypothetical protein